MPIYYYVGNRAGMEARSGQKIATAMIEHPSGVHGLATGNTVKEPYRHGLEYLRQRQANLTKLRTRNLDEWDFAGHTHLIGRSDIRTFRGFTDFHLLTPLSQMGFLPTNAGFPSDVIPRGQRLTAGMDLSAYDRGIEQEGGVHTWTIGIGQAEPESPFRAHFAFVEFDHLVDLGDGWINRQSYSAALRKSTRENNKGYEGCEGRLEKVPNLAFTVGPATLLNHVTVQVILLAFGEKKAGPLRGALELEPGPTCPASIVQLIAAKGIQVHVFMDEAAASQLSERSRIVC